MSEDEIIYIKNVLLVFWEVRSNLRVNLSLVLFQSCPPFFYPFSFSCLGQTSLKPYMID